MRKIDFTLGDSAKMKVQLSGNACYLFINTHINAAPQVTIIKCFYGVNIFICQISAKADNDYVEFVKDDSNTWFIVKSISACRGNLYILNDVLVS